MAYEFTVAGSRSLTTISTPVNTLPITMSAFFNMSATPAVLGIFVSVGTQSGTNRLTLGINAARQVNLQTISSSPNAGGTVASGTASLNTWTHACSVNNSNTLRSCYRDGANKVTNTNTNGTLTSFDYVAIGTRYVSGVLGGFIDGSVAEVGIWNVALTDAEIASLADGMTCDKVRPQSLVFYAPLVRDLIDYKGKLTITNNNGATVANHPRVYA
jgi:hypothetical protein